MFHQLFRMFFDEFSKCSYNFLIFHVCSLYLFPRHETLDRARDKFRVKSCLWMMVACTVICIVQIVRGKQAAERGESVVQANLDWHREYNEAAKKNEAKSK